MKSRKWSGNSSNNRPSHQDHMKRDVYKNKRKWDEKYTKMATGKKAGQQMKSQNSKHEYKKDQLISC